MCELASVAFDPWNSSQLVTELEDAGVTMVEMRQGFASMAHHARRCFV